MSKITLTDLVNLENQTTAVNAINANNAVIKTAFDNTLSRDGTNPNVMNASLDMNSHTILNLPTPTSNYEPLRVIDAATVNGGGITVSPLPVGGVAGNLLLKNSSVNYDVSWGTLASSTQPMVRRYVIGRGTLALTTGCTLFNIKSWGGGGGGSGINCTNFIPQSQYGGRGWDTAWDTLTPFVVTIATGVSTTITKASHGLVANQSLWFTTTGALPTGLTVGTASTGTVYYVIGSSITANTFRISTRPSTPFPGDVQPEVATSGTQSGVHSAVAYQYIVQGGGGGGIIGDQGTPLAYIGYASDGYSWAAAGGSGGGVYGQNVGGGAGGGGTGGGAGQGGIATAGNDLTGGGGAGAGAISTASGGTGGASGTYGEIWKRPDKTLFNYMIGEPGTAGLAGAQPVTMTIASPAVFTITDHGFLGEEQFTLTTTGALPTGLALATTYYVLQSSSATPIGANTFYASTSLRGSPLITTGSQSGVHTFNSGAPGGIGGRGSLILTEFIGV